ncbi:MAG: membrane protein insertion efficiency factor YidD [Acidobacteriaceae bacterium]
MTRPVLGTVRTRMVETLLVVYKRVLSPALHALPGLPGACRFQPTCSEYAAIAIAEHGFIRGTLMALGRLARCHPLHPGGFDPVPPRHKASSSGIQARPTQ